MPLMPPSNNTPQPNTLPNDLEMPMETLGSEAAVTSAPETTGISVSGTTVPAKKTPALSIDQAVAVANGVTESELQELRANEVAISWQASEYVHHQKGVAWYLGLAAIMVVLLGLALLVRDWVAIVAFVVAAVAVMVYAHKPPRTLLYELSPGGITIDGRMFPFSEFRSFGVLPEVEWHQIDLEPTKRFTPRITVMFRDEDFEAIVGHLELHLPRVDRKPDMTERISRYLRF